MESHTAWHRLLKYSQNQRFTTQLVSMEGSQCESIGLYLSNNQTPQLGGGLCQAGIKSACGWQTESGWGCEVWLLTVCFSSLLRSRFQWRAKGQQQSLSRDTTQSVEKKNYITPYNCGRLRRHRYSSCLSVDDIYTRPFHPHPTTAAVTVDRSRRRRRHSGLAGAGLSVYARLISHFNIVK